MTKKQLQEINDRLVHALHAITTTWETTRDLRPAIELANGVLDDVLGRKDDPCRAGVHRT